MTIRHRAAAVMLLLLLLAALQAGCGGSQHVASGTGAAKPTTTPGSGVPAAPSRTARHPRAPAKPRRAGRLVQHGSRPHRARHPGSDPAGPSHPAPRSSTRATPTPHPRRATKPVARKRSPATPQPAAPATVVLIVHGGGTAEMSACGSRHHYRTYASGATVVYSGTVHPIPSGIWKVKLKIKVCSGGAFQYFTKLVAVRDKHFGTFRGTFPAPAAGIYELRATFYVHDAPVAKSNKRHILTR